MIVCFYFAFTDFTWRLWTKPCYHYNSLKFIHLLNSFIEKRKKRKLSPLFYHCCFCCFFFTPCVCMCFGWPLFWTKTYRHRQTHALTQKEDSQRFEWNYWKHIESVVVKKICGLISSSLLLFLEKKQLVKKATFFFTVHLHRYICHRYCIL